LLKNLGNFSNRCLKFLASSFDGKVPAYEGARHTVDDTFIKGIYEKFEEFMGLMEQIKIKDSLRTVMATSSLCNAYMQETQPWVLAKSDMPRCKQVMFTAIQTMQFLAALLEPFMPSFSAKVYEQMNIKRTETHEIIYDYIKGHPERLNELVPAGHQIGDPQPIFREISDEEMNKFRSEFGESK